jgi:signal transduction histidine kinase
VQEALNNCERHSSASQVSVQISQDSNGIMAVIPDDGCGIQEEQRGISGLGILGMRERAAMLGGGLTLESAAGKGSKVTLFVPATALRAGPF